MSRVDQVLQIAQGLVEAMREGFLFGREVALTLRQGAAVVRERRIAQNIVQREEIDELRARLKACEDECRTFGRSGREAVS